MRVSTSLLQLVSNCQSCDGPISFSPLHQGNDNRDACNYSPAAAEKAVTVGASTIGDERAYFSNYGKCVDVFAPGKSLVAPRFVLILTQ